MKFNYFFIFSSHFLNKSKFKKIPILETLCKNKLLLYHLVSNIVYQWYDAIIKGSLQLLIIKII